jgi:hypothetical protein
VATTPTMGNIHCCSTATKRSKVMIIFLH